MSHSSPGHGIGGQAIWLLEKEGWWCPGRGGVGELPGEVEIAEPLMDFGDRGAAWLGLTGRALGSHRRIFTQCRTRLGSWKVRGGWFSGRILHFVQGSVLRGNPSAQLPGPREAHASLLPASWARPIPAAVSAAPLPRVPQSPPAQIRHLIARCQPATRVNSTAFDLRPAEIKPISN